MHNGLSRYTLTTGIDSDPSANHHSAADSRCSVSPSSSRQKVKLHQQEGKVYEETDRRANRHR